MATSGCRLCSRASATPPVPGIRSGRTRPPSGSTCRFTSPERIDYASLAPLAEELGALRARDDIDWDQYVLELGDLYHDYFVNREEFYLILRFYAMGDDRPPEITEGMRDAYVQIGWELEAGLAASCEARGFRLREDRSMTQLVGSISALAEGFALRHRVGPEIPQVEVDGRMHRPFSIALRALVFDYLVRV